MPAPNAGDFQRGPASAGPLCLRGAFFGYLTTKAPRAELRDSRNAADWKTVRLVGLLLLVGAAVTLGLHVLDAPEELYRWLYHHLLSGLDVPEDPSEGTVDTVRYVSLIGGLLELAAGLVLLAVDRLRPEKAGGRA